MQPAVNHYTVCSSYMYIYMFSTLPPTSPQPLTHTKHRHLDDLGGWCETISPEPLRLPYYPPVVLKDTLINSRGHWTYDLITSLQDQNPPPNLGKCPSQQHIRPQEGFRLQDEGQCAIALFHAEELCYFRDKLRLYGFSLWLMIKVTFVCITFWYSGCKYSNVQSGVQLWLQPTFIIDGLLMRYHQKCYVTSCCCFPHDALKCENPYTCLHLWNSIWQQKPASERYPQHKARPLFTDTFIWTYTLLFWNRADRGRNRKSINKENGV